MSLEDVATSTPTHLRHLSEETIRFLDRLDEEDLKRLDQFLSLDEAQWKAGFAVVTAWTRWSWLGKTALWLLVTSAGIALAIRQILDFVGAK